MNTPFRSKTSRIALAVVAVVGLGALGSFFLSNHADHACNSSCPPPTRVTNEGSLTIVTLDETTQTISGIQSESIIASRHQAEHIAYGSVLDVQGLNDLNTRLRNGSSRLSSRHSLPLRLRARNMSATLALFKANQSVALKVLQASQVTWNIDKTKLQATECQHAVGTQQRAPTIWCSLG